MTINTVTEVVKPIGRPGFAIDFPIETDRFDPKELAPLVGREVYLQTKEGPFSFCGSIGTDKKFVTITDLSTTKLYCHQRYNEEVIQIDLDNISLLEWNETVTKRIARRSGS